MMRQNVLSLCTEDRFSALRDSIIYLKKPQSVDPDELTFLEETYLKELGELNDEQKVCVIKSILCGTNA